MGVIISNTAFGGWFRSSSVTVNWKIQRKSMIRRRLSEVVWVLSPHPFRGALVPAEMSEVRAVQMRDIDEHGKVNWQGCVRTELSGKKKPNWLKPGDLLFVARGKHYSVEVDENVPKDSVVATPQFFCLRIKDETAVRPAYLSWLLNQKIIQDYFERNAEGARAKNIRREVLESVEVAIPPVQRQDEILSLERKIQEEKQCAQGLIEQGSKIMDVVAENLFH